MTVLLIDGMSLLKGAPRTLAGLTNGHSFHFLRTLRSVMTDTKKEYGDIQTVIVCWEGNPVKRKEALPTYKSKRSRSPDSVVECRKKVQKILTLMNVFQAHHPEFEGDDVVAHFANIYSKLKLQVVIYSGDFDLRQMVGTNVALHQKEKVRKVKSTSRKKPWITLENFESVTGWPTPKEFLLAKTVQGDGSDEIPGLEGVSIDSVSAYFHNLPMSESKKAQLSEWFSGSEGFLKNISLMALPHPEFSWNSVKMVTPTKNKLAVKALLEEYGFASILKSFPSWWETFDLVEV